MHSVDITALLKKLCEGACLESDNNGRWTTYKIKQKVDTSSRKVDTSDRKVDTSNGNIDKRSRLSKEELEIEIMRICKSNYIKMENVALALGKSVDYLKNKVFPQMIKDGKLEKHFPFTHNHPEQGYKTTERFAKKI